MNWKTLSYKSLLAVTCMDLAVIIVTVTIYPTATIRCSMRAFLKQVLSYLRKLSKQSSCRQPRAVTTEKIAGSLLFVDLLCILRNYFYFGYFRLFLFLSTHLLKLNNSTTTRGANDTRTQKDKKKFSKPYFDDILTFNPS